MINDYDELLDVLMENFDKIKTDNDNIDLIANSAAEFGRLDFSIKLWEKFEEYRRGEDSLDEYCYEQMITFYNDHATNQAKSVELLNKALDENVYLYNWMLEDITDSLFSGGLEKESFDFLERNIHENDRSEFYIVEMFLNNFLMKNNPEETIKKIDELLGKFGVELNNPEDVKVRERFSNNLLISSDQIQNKDLVYGKHSLIELKGGCSFRDKYMTNQYAGKSDLGQDYRGKVPVTSMKVLDINDSKEEITVRTDFRLFNTLKNKMISFDGGKISREIKSLFDKFVCKIQRCDDQEVEEEEEEVIGLGDLFATEEIDQDETTQNITEEEENKDEENKEEENEEEEEEEEEEETEETFVKENNEVIDLFETRSHDPVKIFNHKNLKPREIIVDVLSPYFAEEIIIGDTEKSKRHSKVYDSVTKEEHFIKEMIYFRMKLMSKTEGAAQTLKFLEANRDFYGDDYIEYLFKLYKNCIDISEIMKLENRFYGIIKRLYFDYMNIKEVTNLVYPPTLFSKIITLLKTKTENCINLLVTLNIV